MSKWVTHVHVLFHASVKRGVVARSSVLAPLLECHVKPREAVYRSGSIEQTYVIIKLVVEIGADPFLLHADINWIMNPKTLRDSSSDLLVMPFSIPPFRNVDFGDFSRQ